jgi:membrane associated rhomboid family serine protease
MLFPISDDDRLLSKPAYVTWFLLAANVALFVLQLSTPMFTYGWSVIPMEIVKGIDLVEPVLIDVGGGQMAEIPQAAGPSPIYLTLISSMFMHGGYGHIGGNMLYLWIFGDNVEHRFGHWRFLAFYLVSGLAASAAQIATGPESVIPNLGASGAISGVLGAYIVLFPRNRVNAVFFMRIVAVPAVVVIGMWAVMQLLSGTGSIAQTGQGGGVAYAAHIGGFVAGVLLALLVRRSLGNEPDSLLYRHSQRDPRSRPLW